jgi:hypothetical protein
MEKENVRELIAKFNAQQATQAEIDQIEKLIESGSIEMSELHGFNDIDAKVSKLDFASPSSHLDDRFYHMLAKEQASRTSFSWRGFFSWPELAPKLALASVMLVIGVGVGYLLRPAAVTTSSTEMVELGKQMSEMKEMMMLTLLEKESASERLKAVSLTQDMDKASEKVTSALIQTLNNDENVNVRLAALDALRPYLANSGVREELIRSIAQQDSPLVQVALADMMAAAQVKSSVKELEKILKNEKTPSDVKNRIQKSIDILI